MAVEMGSMHVQSHIRVGRQGHLAPSDCLPNSQCALFASLHSSLVLTLRGAKLSCSS